MSLILKSLHNLSLHFRDRTLAKTGNKSEQFNNKIADLLFALRQYESGPRKAMVPILPYLGYVIWAHEENRRDCGSAVQPGESQQQEGLRSVVEA